MSVEMALGKPGERDGDGLVMFKTSHNRTTERINVCGAKEEQASE